MDKKTVYQTVERDFNDSPYGIDCVFVKLSDDQGIKLYSSKTKRDRAHDRQSCCQKIGLAPKVYGKFDLPMSVLSKGYKYGYLTEVVQLVDWEEVGGAWEWAYKNKEKIEEIQTMIQQEIGWYFYDFHGKNWGYLDNGQMVPIDFG